MQPIKILQTHARTLALGAMLALTVVSLPAAHARAEPRAGYEGQGYCVSPFLGDGTIFKPGETVVVLGHTVECQADGSWKVVSRSVQPVRPVAPHPVGLASAP